MILKEIIKVKVMQGSPQLTEKHQFFPQIGKCEELKRQLSEVTIEKTRFILDENVLCFRSQDEQISDFTSFAMNCTLPQNSFCQPSIKIIDCSMEIESLDMQSQIAKPIRYNLNLESSDYKISQNISFDSSEILTPKKEETATFRQEQAFDFKQPQTNFKQVSDDVVFKNDFELVSQTVQQQRDWPQLQKQFSCESFGKLLQVEPQHESQSKFKGSQNSSIDAVSADETQVFQLTQQMAVNFDNTIIESSHFGPKQGLDVDLHQTDEKLEKLDNKQPEIINARDNDFSFINCSPRQSEYIGNHNQDSKFNLLGEIKQIVSVRDAFGDKQGDDMFNRQIQKSFSERQMPSPQLIKVTSFQNLAEQNHDFGLQKANEILMKKDIIIKQSHEQFTTANSINESPISQVQTPTLFYDSLEEQENQILIEPGKRQLQIESYGELTLNSKFQTLSEMTESLKGWLQELELIKLPHSLIKRTLIAVSQVLHMEIKDWQIDSEIFFRYCKKNTAKFSSATFILKLCEDNFKIVNSLMEEPDFKSELQSISQVSLFILEFALLLEETYEKCKLVQVSKDEDALLPRQSSYLHDNNIQINPDMMELEPFDFMSIIQFGEHNTVNRINSADEFALNIPQINIACALNNDHDLNDAYSTKNPFINELNKFGSNIQHQNEVSPIDQDEIANQICYIKEKPHSLKMRNLEPPVLIVNRKLDVNELNLRDLSSEKESELSQEKKKRSRFRKPFNSFKEDKLTKKHSQTSHEHDYEKFGLQAFHSLHPFFKSTVELKPQRKKRRNRSNKSPANWQTVNTGQKERIDECYPSLNSNKSQANAISVFKNHEAMTDMQQRYLTFNSYIQAQNRIEMLARENLHLQKLLISSQHDLRLLQRFTKKYFKSIEFFKQKELFGGDEETLKVLMNCFQEKPVVLLAFSSPLVRKIEHQATQRITISEMPLLDFTKEFEGAVKGIQQTKNAIKIAYIQATVEKLFQFCIDENPVGMHFSGHGVSNEKTMQGANCLVMETEDGCAHYLTEEQITQFIKDLNTPLKFVFLASCHSEFAGFLFHIAGVEHVICVKQKEEIYDQAAIILAKHFYNFLFSERNTVCKAFERAKLFLSSSSDPKLSKEANKFIMIKDSDDISERMQQFNDGQHGISLGKRHDYTPQCKNHQCKVLGPFIPGDIEVMNKKPFFPFEIKQFGTEQIIGRQLDIQSIVEIIKQKNRIVVVQGLVGIGKSAVIKKVGKFFYDRESFRDGVIYFSMRDRQFVNILVFKMHSFITKHKIDDDNDLNYKETLSSSSKSSNSQHLSQLQSLPELKEKGNELDFELPNPNLDFKQLVDKDKIHQICACLRSRECLVIIDNADDVLRSDEEQFNKFFEILLHKCPDIQLLISSNEHLHHKIPQTQFYKLNPLTNSHSLELLELKSCKKISPQEKRELLEKTAANKNHNEFKPKITRLEDHHLCTILGGHQGAITLLAPLYKNRSLLDFYKQLVKMFADPGLLQNISQIGCIYTLEISLTATTKHLQKNNPLALQLFSLVGLLPGGVYEKDLTLIWGDEKWILLSEVLVQDSLMNVKNENTHGDTLGKRKYALLQFMNKFAESLLSQFDLKKFHERICDQLQDKVNYYFNSCCVEHAKNKQTQHQMEIVEYEVNIWACIYRILDFHTPKDDQQKLMAKINRNNLHNQTGYSSTEENQFVTYNRNVEITDVSDTCDDHTVNYRDDTSFTPTLTANNNSISPSVTEQKPNSRNHSKSGTERKMSSCEQKQEQQIQSSICTSYHEIKNQIVSPKQTKLFQFSRKKEQKVKQSAKKNPPPVESRSRLSSHDENDNSFPLKHNVSIEKRVSLQLAQIEKSQQKWIKSLPLENSKNITLPLDIPKNLSYQLDQQNQINHDFTQNEAFSDIEEEINEESKFDSIKAQNQFEIEQSFYKDVTSFAAPHKDNNTEFNYNYEFLSACFHIEDISCRSHSIIEIENSSIQGRTYATMENPQDNPDCLFYPQTEENQTQKEETTENFPEELMRQNLTYLTEKETNELTPRMIFSVDNNAELQREGENQMLSAAGSEAGLKFTLVNEHNQSSSSINRSDTPQSRFQNGSTPTKTQQKAQKYNYPQQIDSSEPQSSSKEEDGAYASKNFQSTQKLQEVSINPALGFIPKSMGLTIQVNNESLSHDWKQNMLQKQAGLQQPLSSIEERYFKEMTNEQKLIVTYISLLVLSQRSAFALRAISLIDQHLKNKLVCHANLTKLYGLCIIKSKPDRIKDAFKLFKKAKQIFKMVGGDNNNANMGIAQCYMIKGNLIRTKAEQLFGPNPQNKHGEKLTELDILKKALKRLVAAKQIYKERQHLAGQLFCCQELQHIYKPLKIPLRDLLKEQKELEQRLRGAYKEFSRLICVSGQNTHVFINRNEGMEMSLIIEIIDYHQIVNTQLSKTRKTNNNKNIVRNQNQEKPLRVGNSKQIKQQNAKSSTTVNLNLNFSKQMQAFKGQGKNIQQNKKNFKPAKITSNSGDDFSESKNENEESQSEQKVSQPKKVTNKVLQMKAKQEVQQIKQKKQAHIIDKNKKLKCFQSEENLLFVGIAPQSTEVIVEKPRKTNKYAHINPKVDTNLRNHDQQSTTVKDMSFDHHSSGEDMKQSNLSDNVSLIAPVVDIEDSRDAGNSYIKII